MAIQLACGRAHPFPRWTIQLPGQHARKVKAMRLTYRAMLTLFAFTAVTVTAGAQDKLEVFAGYSYLRPAITTQQEVACEVIIICPPPTPRPVTSHPNLNGYEFSATYKLIPWLGV